jgi:hypothetical protein
MDDVPRMSPKYINSMISFKEYFVKRKYSYLTFIFT